MDISIEMGFIFNSKVDKWAQEAGENVTVHYMPIPKGPSVTAIGESNPFWVAFDRAIKEL